MAGFDGSSFTKGENGSWYAPKTGRKQAKVGVEKFGTEKSSTSEQEAVLYIDLGKGEGCRKDFPISRTRLR
jgi:hypothetical protein